MGEVLPAQVLQVEENEGVQAVDRREAEVHQVHRQGEGVQEVEMQGAPAPVIEEEQAEYEDFDEER